MNLEGGTRSSESIFQCKAEVKTQAAPIECTNDLNHNKRGKLQEGGNIGSDDGTAYKNVTRIKYK